MATTTVNLFRGRRSKMARTTAWAQRGCQRRSVAGSGFDGTTRTPQASLSRSRSSFHRPVCGAALKDRPTLGRNQATINDRDYQLASTTKENCDPADEECAPRIFRERVWNRIGTGGARAGRAKAHAAGNFHGFLQPRRLWSSVAAVEAKIIPVSVRRPYEQCIYICPVGRIIQF